MIYNAYERLARILRDTSSVDSRRLRGAAVLVWAVMVTGSAWTVNASFSKTYACADFNSYPNATCSADVWSVAGTNWAIGDTLSHNLNSVATFYYSALNTGTGDYYVHASCSGADGPYTHVTASVYDLSVSDSGASGNCGLEIQGQYAGSYTGDISMICISDTPGLCADPTGGGGGGASATTSTTTSSIDQTEQNMFNAYWSFLATVFFMVWLVRSTKK